MKKQWKSPTWHSPENRAQWQALFAQLLAQVSAEDLHVLLEVDAPLTRAWLSGRSIPSEKFRSHFQRLNIDFSTVVFASGGRPTAAEHRASMRKAVSVAKAARDVIGANVEPSVSAPVPTATQSTVALRDLYELASLLLPFRGREAAFVAAVQAPQTFCVARSVSLPAVLAVIAKF